MKKSKQIKIEFDSIQTEEINIGNNSSVSHITEGKIISFSSYIEQKKSEMDRIAIHNSLLGLANYFPKNTK